MKRIFFLFVIFSLLFTPLSQVEAQTQSNVLDLSNSPQWVRDLRRFDIILFGVFPFSMFFTTFAMDMIRWNEANGFDWEDRRYAPWPLKTAGAVEMTPEEQLNTILIAAGVSAVIALTDFIIVKIRQGVQRRRIESRPTGTVTIERTSISNVQDSTAAEIETNVVLDEIIETVDAVDAVETDETVEIDDASILRR
jgi:hypothetical protein